MKRLEKATSTIERMSCDEIRQRFKEGAGLKALAELNSTNINIIHKIIAGEDYKWTEKNNPKPYRQAAAVVDVSEGMIYPSIRKAELANGYSQGLLAHKFRAKGNEVTTKDGKIFRLYRKGVR